MTQNGTSIGASSTSEQQKCCLDVSEDGGEIRVVRFQDSECLSHVTNSVLIDANPAGPVIELALDRVSCLCVQKKVLEISRVAHLFLSFNHTHVTFPEFHPVGQVVNL
jgi:hypothetical protein